MKYEVWCRVSGSLMDWCDTHEEAEAVVEEFAPYQDTLVILEVDED